MNCRERVRSTAGRYVTSVALGLLGIVYVAGVSTMAQSTPPEKSRSHTRPVRRDVVWHTWEVVEKYPHDPAAFTQGLVWHEGRLYEGTGLVGFSSLRRVKLETGEVEKKIDIAPNLFGEGIVIWIDSVVQITWQNHIGFVYDLDSFAQRRSFGYEGEGWGLTHDGTHLIMSNGTSVLTLRDPETLEETGRIDVTFRGQPLSRLNELEYIDGSIWANVWPTNQIVIISPSTGRVSGVLDLTGILTPEDQGNRGVDVLNGIAYDASSRRIFVTGKYWPTLYEIRVR